MEIHYDYKFMSYVVPHLTHQFPCQISLLSTCINSGSVKLFPFDKLSLCCRVFLAMLRAPSLVSFPPMNPPAWTNIHPLIPLKALSASSLIPRHSSNKLSLSRGNNSLVEKICFPKDCISILLLILKVLSKCMYVLKRSSATNIKIKFVLSCTYLFSNASGRTETH